MSGLVLSHAVHLAETLTAGLVGGIAAATLVVGTLLWLAGHVGGRVRVRRRAWANVRRTGVRGPGLLEPRRAPRAAADGARPHREGVGRRGAG